jgi:hypothetical protein
MSIVKTRDILWSAKKCRGRKKRGRLSREYWIEEGRWEGEKSKECAQRHPLRPTPRKAAGLVQASQWAGGSWE